MSIRKPMDVSALYDELKKLGGTIALGVDIVNFMQINEKYGYAAGDIVIAEALARKIINQNNASVKAGEHDIPLSLHVGIGRIPGKALSYQKALAILGNAVNKARKSPDRVAVYAEEPD